MLMFFINMTLTCHMFLFSSFVIFKTMFIVWRVLVLHFLTLFLGILFLWWSVNGFIFLVFFLVCSSLLYRNTSDFCILTLHLQQWLTHFSSIFFRGFSMYKIASFPNKYTFAFFFFFNHSGFFYFISLPNCPVQNLQYMTE